MARHDIDHVVARRRGSVFNSCFASPMTRRCRSELVWAIWQPTRELLIPRNEGSGCW